MTLTPEEHASPLKISEAKVPFGLKRVRYECQPPLEEWPMLPDQSHLWKGDFIKRLTDGYILNVPLEECTHVFIDTLNGVAYVQKVTKP